VPAATSATVATAAPTMLTNALMSPPSSRDRDAHYVRATVQRLRTFNTRPPNAVKREFRDAHAAGRSFTECATSAAGS